jgi:hypothetical protein
MVSLAHLKNKYINLYIDTKEQETLPKRVFEPNTPLVAISGKEHMKIKGIYRPESLIPEH